MYRATTALRRIRALNKRLRIVQGGSSAGKTIAILLILIDIAQRRKLLISVVSETVPHLRRGAIRDFKSIMEEQGYWRDDRWNETNFIYTFETGAQIEFFSADTPTKVRGPRRDILFVNEANNISFETYTQLAIRTNETIYLDYNPVAEFWVHTELPRAEMDFLILTYKDNEALAPAIVAEIESRRNNKQFWRVYGEGQIGLAEGVIYPNWQDIDEVPKEARLVRRWLDYGYTNDPTAIGDIYKWNDAYVLDEVAYQKGLLNNQIADIILNQEEQVPVAADSAEPKSNDELALRGITILPAKKGADSVNNGIQIVQRQKIFVTKRSVNIRKEQRNYQWLVDKDGKITNEPSPIWNHHMDGVRYGFSTLLDFMPDNVRIQQERYMQHVAERQDMNSSR
jgi:phage terminase large subunit